MSARIERVIMATPGVDMAFVGPNDLAGSINLLERMEEPPVQAALERGIAEADIRQSARLLLEYEKMFWDAVAAAAGV